MKLNKFKSPNQSLVSDILDIDEKQNIGIGCYKKIEIWLLFHKCIDLSYRKMSNYQPPSLIR